jgi:hypothetical protein
MPSTPARTCIHVFISGHQCGSPALRDSTRCYNHHKHRRLKRSQLRIDLATPEGRLATLSQLTHAIATHRIDPEVARSLLYGIHLATGKIK